MFVKGIVFTAVVASTPLAIAVTQDPSAPTAPAVARAPRQADELAAVRAELAAARAEVQQLRSQLDRALDVLDRNHEPQRDRNCSPSRGRALMSHFQWLRDEGHGKRAAATLAKVVDQVGDDAHRLESTARELMTDKDTSGKFDDIALALVQRLEPRAAQLQADSLDTMALAYFLAGQADRAVEFERQAIERGGNHDALRRRLRTYEAARDAIAKARTSAVEPTLLAGKE